MARKGEWRVMAEDFQTDEDFRAAVEQELAGLENMMFRLGDGMQVAPLRAQLQGGEYVTVGYFFRNVFVPAVGTPGEENVPSDPDPEEKPIAEDDAEQDPEAVYAEA